MIRSLTLSQVKQWIQDHPNHHMVRGGIFTTSDKSRSDAAKAKASYNSQQKSQGTAPTSTSNVYNNGQYKSSSSSGSHSSSTISSLYSQQKTEQEIKQNAAREYHQQQIRDSEQSTGFRKAESQSVQQDTPQQDVSEQNRPQQNRRGRRPSPNFKNKKTNLLRDFADGLYAPVHNMGKDIARLPDDLEKIISGKAHLINHEYEDYVSGNNYKPTLIDDTLKPEDEDNPFSADNPRYEKSPAYYAGTAVTDVGMFVAPIPAGKGAIAAKTAVSASKNLSKTQKIAKATREKDVIDNIEQVSKSTVKKTTKGTRNKKRFVKETVTKVTPDVYRIDRGTELHTADIPVTFVEFGRKGKTINVHKGTTREPDTIEIHGNVDKTNKKYLSLKEKRKNVFVSTRRPNQKDKDIIDAATYGQKLKAVGDVEKFSTKDAVALAEEFVKRPKHKKFNTKDAVAFAEEFAQKPESGKYRTKDVVTFAEDILKNPKFDKYGNITYDTKRIPAKRPSGKVSRIYQTEQQGINSKHENNVQLINNHSIGSKNFDKLLARLGLSPPKKNNPASNRGKKSSSQFFKDLYDDPTSGNQKTVTKNTDAIKDDMTKQYQKSHKNKQSEQTQHLVKMTGGLDGFFIANHKLPPAKTDNENVFGLDISPESSVGQDLNSFADINVKQNLSEKLYQGIEEAVGFRTPTKTKPKQDTKMDEVPIQKTVPVNDVGFTPDFVFTPILDIPEKRRTTTGTRITHTTPDDNPPWTPIITEPSLKVPSEILPDWFFPEFLPETRIQKTIHSNIKRGWVIPDMPFVSFNFGEFFESNDNSAYTKAARKSSGKKPYKKKRKKKSDPFEWF